MKRIKIKDNVSFEELRKKYGMYEDLDRNFGKSGLIISKKDRDIYFCYGTGTYILPIVFELVRDGLVEEYEEK